MKLYVFVEGRDDMDYINKILKPRLIQQYDDIKPIMYKSRTKKYLGTMMHTFKHAKKDYIILTDQDNPKICNMKRKEQLVSNLFPHADKHDIIVVKTEIESWYLAGITNANATKIGFNYHSNTELINKEKFNDLIPSSFDTRKDFVDVLIELYDFEKAKNSNASLRYFAERFGI